MYWFISLFKEFSQVPFRDYHHLFHFLQKLGLESQTQMSDTHLPFDNRGNQVVLVHESCYKTLG